MIGWAALGPVLFLPTVALAQSPSSHAGGSLPLAFGLLALLGWIGALVGFLKARTAIGYACIAGASAAVVLCVVVVSGS